MDDTPPSAFDGYDGPDPVARLFREYGREEAALFAIGLVASLFGRTAGLVPPLVLGVTIDAVLYETTAYDLPLVPAGWLPATRTGQLQLSVALIAGALVGGVAVRWVQGVSTSLFSNRVQHAVRVDAYDAMQRLDTAFFDDRQTGQILSVLNNDVRNLKSFLDTTVTGALQLVVTVAAIAGILLWLNAQLALVTLVGVPLILAFTVWFMRTVRPLYGALRAGVGDLNTRLENNVDGMEVIRTAGTETFEADRVEAASRDLYDRAMAVVKLDYLYQPGMDLLAGVAFAVTFAIGGVWLVTGPPGPFSGPLYVGEFVTFLFMTQRFVDPLAGAGRIVTAYENARASSARVFSLFDLPVAVADEPDAEPLRDPAGAVAFDDVSFAYRDGHPVLRDVSFDAAPGETVALVGPTGAGKTTAAKLLLRLYDPGEGTIAIDGRDLHGVTLDSLRRATGYVGQDVFLFDGTVRENVAYGSPDATDDEIEAAARAAEAHEFVTRLPDGYDTRVGERGVKLSGGQRQRLAIARALLQDPAVLVLDEATSAVDTETELAIKTALDRLTDDRTTLVIAHRLSTVRDADRILVLDRGRVVEAGSHDDLLDHDGLYAALWRVQVGDLDDLPDEFVARATAAADAVDVESED